MLLRCRVRKAHAVPSSSFGGNPMNVLRVIGTFLLSTASIALALAVRTWE
jgi:hypothetical protein